jgi:hypothetical protein
MSIKAYYSFKMAEMMAIPQCTCKFTKNVSSKNQQIHFSKSVKRVCENDVEKS